MRPHVSNTLDASLIRRPQMSSTNSLIKRWRSTALSSPPPPPSPTAAAKAISIVSSVRLSICPPTTSHHSMLMLVEHLHSPTRLLWPSLVPPSFTQSPRLPTHFCLPSPSVRPPVRLSQSACLCACLCVVPKVARSVSSTVLQTNSVFKDVSVVRSLPGLLCPFIRPLPFSFLPSFLRRSSGRRPSSLPSFFLITTP